MEYDKYDKRWAESGIEVFPKNDPSHVIGFLVEDKNGWRWILNAYPGGESGGCRTEDEAFHGLIDYYTGLVS